ncbi:hypothetical protein [Bdellovibrio svalbardensis]|uniref:Uncharacterized protein n=1 Tax=Bdellovibrio svalbardensis TaxID=2972972 RepID=A0ABT6DI18_9BACT|nr:hypothetical protein [Bdellovibrio svalbardensis]MDG0816503.1 hypothetical protein [Bdellovibrio svalbardensis]
MKNQRRYKRSESKKAAQRGLVSGRKPKKASLKLGAHHFHETKKSSKVKH